MASGQPGPLHRDEIGGQDEEQAGGNSSRSAVRSDVLLQVAGPLMLAQRPQIASEVVGRAQGDGVVLAEHPTAAGEGILLQLARLLMLAQCTQVESEAAG